MSSQPVSLPNSLAPSPYAARFSQVHAGIAVLAILSAIYLAWPVWRIASPLEFSRNEPWNAWFIDALLAGKPLYPSSSELIVNNYPPLSFYLTALVAQLTGDIIIAGRLISLFSAFLFSVAAGLSIRALGASRAVAILGGFWLLATLARFFPYYVAVNDPSLLGIALMGLGLAWFLHRMRAGRAVEPAIALMVVAGFVKHNMPALPLAALIWLAMKSPWAALRAAVFGAILSAAGLLLCIAALGPDFVQQMLMPREMSLHHVFFALNRLQWIAPAVAVWGLWAWPNRNEPTAQFTALLLGLSLANGLIQAAGAGVTYNAYFGAVFASAIGVALAFERIASTPLAKRFGAGTLQAAIIAVLVLRLLLWMRAEPYFVIASPSFREDFRRHETVMNAEIARIFSHFRRGRVLAADRLLSSWKGLRLRSVLGAAAHRNGPMDEGRHR